MGLGRGRGAESVGSNRRPGQPGDVTGQEMLRDGQADGEMAERWTWVRQQRISGRLGCAV